MNKFALVKFGNPRGLLASSGEKEFMLIDPFKIVDLTHPLSPCVPTWDGSCSFYLEIKQDYTEMFRVQQIKMVAGIGTHMDAPSHRIPGGRSIAEIPVEQLIVPACVIDVSNADADYEISVQDVRQYENTHGIIPERSLVIGYTGWDRFWPDSTAYRNVDVNGQMRFPAFSSGAVKLLLKRNISGIAIDTLSPDCLDASFTVHRLILGAGKYIIENIANCSKIPARGAYVFALPLPLVGGSEAPIRIVALVH